MTWRIWLQAESSRQSCLARRHPRLPELGVENTPEMSDSAYYRIRRGINDVGLPNWWLLVIWYSSAVTFWYLMTCTLLNYWDSIIRILITISVKSSKGHQNSVYFMIVDGQNKMRSEARYYVDILTNVFTILNNYFLQIHFISVPWGGKDGENKSCFLLATMSMTLPSYIHHGIR